MESIQAIKQRFGIIGNDTGLNRALEKTIQVAPTDISVLVTGESGVGKENIPKIAHQLSHRKHAKYIAVNCGAIPEGTIDSELFGHEKGAFTGATNSRNGYFEVADGGTIFLDEVGELPLTTQVRLLRVLENGEFIKVGSSKVQKTNVRIVAATNLNMQKAIKNNKFREDLYYRLSTVEINIPPLREREADIHLLFRKFSSDFAQRYSMPSIKLDDDAVKSLLNYRWDGNIRQLKNIAEQLSVLEEDRTISNKTLLNYLPKSTDSSLPAIISGKDSNDFNSEREILYKVLFDMKGDLNDLKKLTMELMKSSNINEFKENNEHLIKKIYNSKSEKEISEDQIQVVPIERSVKNSEFDYAEEINVESLSIHDKELELIKKSLEKNKGRRKLAAKELGISERTLYRKIKQFNL
ncbi:MAG: sigma-54 dependent transcriptional regulator [Bacteroidota bacterium]|nr:sigma-54 dependent transcriptional regulator [Bacteroidota bacterium]|tara:strand:+ start:6174 stop:7403 length:1230 start_codon:yes stop_codon:yes gene_type:complete